MSTSLAKPEIVEGPLAPTIQPFSPEHLIATAIDKGLPLDTLERLLAMRDKLKAERSREAFFEALSAFQSECPVIEKKQAVKNKDGKSDRYKYAGLGDILKVVGPLLHRHHLSYRLVTEHQPGPPPFMLSTCTVHHADGHSEASTFRVPLIMSGHMNAAQEYGSARTYASRYAFCDAFGIMTGDEDDDGNSLDTPPKPARPAEPPRHQAPPTVVTPKPNGHADPNLPKNGAELLARLQAFDAKLSAAGTCNGGELLAHVSSQGVTVCGYPPELERWVGPAIQFAVDTVKAFVALRSKPAAPPVEDGVKLSNFCRTEGKKLHAQAGCTSEHDLLEEMEKLGKAKGWGTDLYKWQGQQLADGWEKAKAWLTEKWEAVQADAPPEDGEPIEGEIVAV